MIAAGIFIIVCGFALLGFAGSLFGYTEKVERDRDDLLARQGSLTSEEQGRLTFFKLNAIVAKVSAAAVAFGLLLIFFGVLFY